MWCSRWLGSLPPLNISFPTQLSSAKQTWTHSIPQRAEEISSICILNISLLHVPSINLDRAFCPPSITLDPLWGSIIKLQLTKEVRYEAFWTNEMQPLSKTKLWISFRSVYKILLFCLSKYRVYLVLLIFKIWR